MRSTAHCLNSRIVFGSLSLFFDMLFAFLWRAALARPPREECEHGQPGKPAGSYSGRPDPTHVF
jgi:hypothetical protein